MNKKMKNTITSLVTVAFLFSVPACNSVDKLFKSGGDNTSASNTSNTEKSGKNSEDSAKKGLAQEIVGNWKDTNDSQFKFTFTSGGQMTSESDRGRGNFSYKVIDEETIEIQDPGRRQPDKVKVKINGDTMTFDDLSSKKTAVLKRVS